jgi:mono/diheme cytochrome c family protein
LSLEFLFEAQALANRPLSGSESECYGSRASGDLEGAPYHQPILFRIDELGRQIMAMAIPNLRITRLAVQAMFPAVALVCAPLHAGGQTAKPSSVVAGTEAPPSARATSSSTKVIQVYRSACLECHDNDGRGRVVREVLPRVPDFTDSKWLASRSDAELSRSILEGKGKSMPKMKDKLGSVGVNEMVAFVRAFKGGKQVVEDEPEVASEPEKSVERATTTATARSPQPVEPSLPSRSIQAQRGINRNFQRFCAMCHDAAGDGGRVRDSMRAIPNFTDVAWQGKRTDPQLVVSILDGKGTEMPPFRGKLPREQARELVAFIRGFSPTPAKPSRTPADDFEARFRKLEKELEDLRRQSRVLSSSVPSSPASPAKGTQLPPSAPSQPE